ncbi:FRAS1-related extracellular matrix protein 1-like isoform X1 [Argiope bruennichi]|uniref:FRAS1-related extracellular matrix protein 1-like isoform X1 n=1 Tax=Argiope bruennichi TaxID=94029 RepID=UPI002493F08C|nr:FRAS1-related extracellular matrix protein 1-like isoform X1 [Argiope bruennichi]
MELYLLFPLFMFVHASGHLLSKIEDIHVLIGREVFLKPTDIQFQNLTNDSVCKIEVINNEPMTQQVGVLIPQVFDCDFNSRTVKYVHHGSPLLSNDTVKFRAYKLLERDTVSEYFDMLIIIENDSYEVVQPGLPLVIKEFFGITDPVDDAILNFNFSRKDGAICKVRMSRHISHRPAHGQVIVGRERRSIDVIKRRCDDFLQLGLRYEHLKPPSPNIDFIFIIVEVSDPYLNGGDLITEWYQIPVIIEPGFPNLPPKASFSGMYLMDVDQFIITAITPAVLSATDSETPSDQLVFNISKPLLLHQGSIVHLSDHTRPINSFKQSDLNNFDIAYKPPARSFKDRQMFEIGFIIRDPDFAFSEPFTMHIAIRPAITTAPRVSMNVGMVLLEGQSRPLRINNLEVVDSDNIHDVKIFVTGGLHHGRLEVNGKPAVSFTQQDVTSEAVVYYHDDSDSVRDSIHLRIYDGFHSTHVKFPITIIPKDDNYPSLVINVGLKMREGSEVQITPSLLRAIDQDTTDEHVKFVITKPPSTGTIWKKFSWEKAGNDIFAFTQQDLNKGIIYYHHNGDEVFTDSFEIILQDANNPPNVSPTYTVFVRIMPVGDDPPKRDPASSFSLEVKEVDIGHFSSRNLHFMDIDSLDNEIVFTITTSPRFIGSFAHSDPGKIVALPNDAVIADVFNMSAIKSFTQEQINHQKIAYLPPAEEIGPNPLYLQFMFSVTDKDKNTVTDQVFNITILPVNNQVPQLHTGELLVEEGSSTLLSTNELSVYDPDTLSSDLQMSLFTVPLYGSIRRSEQPLRVGDLLSLDDILTLRLEYTHDNSENFKDSFKVGVNDGLHFVSGDVLVSIDPVDDEKPVWKRDLQPQISVTEGGKVLLTSEVLAATDVDTDDTLLYFILTESPQFGNVMLDKRKTNRFTQMDIFNKEVFYVHNNQEIGPNPKEDSMTFIVTDKAFPRLMPHNSHKVFVTILPQNTQSPRLYFKRAILVEEGQRSAITEENLSATDDDTFSGELLIVITKQPEYGYIENSRPSPGYEKSKISKKISAFPLQDVKDGFITFVQHNHSGIEPESDDFEVFVTDGVHNSTAVLVYVSIVLLNDEVPYFSLSNITVDEGALYLMNNESVIAGDRDYPGDILVLSVRNKPRHGSLTHFLQAVNNGPLLEIPFNQLTLENFEKIVYHHDGSENFADSFTLSLNDGVHSVTRTCFVDVNPVNDEPPVLKKNIAAKNVELQGSYVLSNAVLYSEDADSNSSEILYKIIQTVAFGNLEKNSDGEWVLLNPLEFSQEEINLNLIRYRQISKPSSVYEDSFTFYLYDGLHKSPTSTYLLNLVDYGKSSLNVVIEKFIVEFGNRAVLNSSFLMAFDNSSRTEDILFHVIKPPSYGNLIFNTNTSTFAENFTIFNLMNNQLSYKHNDSFNAKNDSFELMITNGVIVKNLTFSISISNANNVPVLEKLSPLFVNMLENKSNIITSENLLFSEPSLLPIKILYSVIEQPKYGYLIYNQNFPYPKKFTQEDVDKGLVSYWAHSNFSSSDRFIFRVSVDKKDIDEQKGNQLIGSNVFQIFSKFVEESPSVFINSPTNLDNVWHSHLGFSINSYNLKATYFNSSAKMVKFTVVKYLDHGYLFHLRDEKIVRTFSQEDINEQLIIIILKNGMETYDYFTFRVSVNESTFSKEYRMDFQWAVVFFPYAEYSVCEDSGSLNIAIQRSGNVNISSYVTISAIEQTAKEGLDYVSRRVSKIQFDPGKTDTTWKIVIVKDDLEEAPIEQMQVTLTDPENCIIINHNRTIVSIYDLNRGSCSQIPVGDPRGSKVANSNFPASFDSSDDSEFLSFQEGNGDGKNTNILNFPMECSQYIYGLLHFETFSQSLYQCDGEKWVQWHPKVFNTQTNAEIFPLDPSLDLDIPEKESTIAEELTSIEEITTLSTFEADSCMKGWQMFENKCYKWHRPSATWNKASEVCKSYQSGDLVIVESLEHNSWLLQLARNKPFWIGLHTKEGTNYWSYKMPNDASFLNWKKGFPRADTKLRCTLVRGSGLWINKNCETHEHSYICSMPLYVIDSHVVK